MLCRGVSYFGRLVAMSGGPRCVRTTRRITMRDPRKLARVDSSSSKLATPNEQLQMARWRSRLCLDSLQVGHGLWWEEHNSWSWRDADEPFILLRLSSFGVCVPIGKCRGNGLAHHVTLWDALGVSHRDSYQGRDLYHDRMMAKVIRKAP